MVKINNLKKFSVVTVQRGVCFRKGACYEIKENGELVKFLFSGDKVVAEEGNGNVIRYIRGLGIISSDSESARTYYHYVSDEQGSITHVLKGEEKEEAEELDRAASAGAEEAGSRVLNYYEYDAFGNTTVIRETVKNRFRYDGEQYDAVMGQYYLRARYYNPVIGRFTQEDTYYGDGLNLYAYCGNNPVGYEDPSGHKVCPTQYSVYKKYREQGMSPKKACEAMREELGLGQKSGDKDYKSPQKYIPTDAEGNPIPLKKQRINGQDIPLPDPAAEGRPHTVLGGKVSSKTGETYLQTATFPGGTWPAANGHDVPWSEVHWTDHDTPQHHTNPHQHIFEYNPDKGGWIRRGPTPYYEEEN